MDVIIEIGGCWLFSSQFIGCGFLLTIGGFLLTIELFYLQLCVCSFCAYNFSFLLTIEAFLLAIEAFAYNGKVHLICTSTDCKQRSSTVSKKTATVSDKKKLSPKSYGH